MFFVYKSRYADMQMCMLVRRDIETQVPPPPSPYPANTYSALKVCLDDFSCCQPPKVPRILPPTLGASPVLSCLGTLDTPDAWVTTPPPPVTGNMGIYPVICCPRWGAFPENW